MKFKVYKTNLGLFVNPEGSIYSLNSTPKINGVDTALAQGWNHLKNVFSIDSYQVLKKGGNKHVGYTLKISSVACDDIPLNRSLEEVEQYYHEDDEEFKWGKYSEYQSLYKPIYETLPDEWVDEPVELNIIRNIQIDNYEKPIEMKIGANVRIQEPNCNVSDELAKVVLYEDIERILTPEFLLHERPCQLAPTQLYSIIRNWVKVNIDSSVAYVSSDYDFCFSVKRRVKIKPLTTKTEIKNARGRSYATPKFTTKTVGTRDEIIFEMAPKAYQSYPVLSHWHADNLKDMAEQLKQYLETLMNEINAEVQECPHCNGCGAIVNKIKLKENL